MVGVPRRENTAPKKLEAATHVLFWSKISKNKKAYRDMVARKKYAKHKKMREQIKEETKESREAQAQRNAVTAKGKKGHQATVKRRRAES